MKLRYMAALVALMLVLGAGTASAKSLYVNANLNANSPIQAYDIVGDSLVYQMTSTPTHYGGAGLAIDSDSETLFVTFEGYSTVDIVDAKTLAVLGTVSAPGASNLAGIVVDEGKQKVYAVDRTTDNLYVYSWDATAKTLTNLLPAPGYIDLPGLYAPGGHADGAHGIALDEVNDLLYVGDGSTTVKVYSTDDFTTLVGTVPVSQEVQGVAVDEVRQYLYTGNSYSPYGSSGLLSQYDLGTATETTISIRGYSGAVTGDNVVGIAVDLETGYVYVTTGDQGFGGSDRILVVDPSDLGLLSATGDIGDPTGLVVPRVDISYNPLNMVKTDDVDEAAPGDVLTYVIYFDNTNQYDVTGVTLVDTLPPEVDYISSLPMGTYDSAAHSVSWDIGTVSAGGSEIVAIDVMVNASAPNGTVLLNTAVIDSAETGQSSQYDETLVIIEEGEEALVLSPASATNVLGTSHTVTATLQDAGGDPIADRVVMIEIISGPHAGISATGPTDASGQLWLGYTGTTEGTDTIVASSMDSQGAPMVSNQVTKAWVGEVPIPEFPTIALPIAAIIGLAFLLQRRKEK